MRKMLMRRTGPGDQATAKDTRRAPVPLDQYGYPIKTSENEDDDTGEPLISRDGFQAWAASGYQTQDSPMNDGDAKARERAKRRTVGPKR